MSSYRDLDPADWWRDELRVIVREDVGLSDASADEIAELILVGIQQLLADVFLAEACGIDAAVHPNGSSGHVRWESLIEQMFQPPADHVIEAREPEFRKLHSIPRLADVSAGDE